MINQFINVLPIYDFTRKPPIPNRADYGAASYVHRSQQKTAKPPPELHGPTVSSREDAKGSGDRKDTQEPAKARSQSEKRGSCIAILLVELQEPDVLFCEYHIATGFWPSNNYWLGKLSY